MADTGKRGSVSSCMRICERVDRTELGEFDALVLGLLLMSHFEGQLVVRDFGFYCRDAHIRLIRVLPEKMLRRWANTEGCYLAPLPSTTLFRRR